VLPRSNNNRKGCIGPPPVPGNDLHSLWEGLSRSNGGGPAPGTMVASCTAGGREAFAGVAIRCTQASCSGEMLRGTVKRPFQQSNSSLPACALLVAGG
jgi:hypothetical protein